MEVYELKPVYDTRKSFYNKAIVIVDANRKKLMSYRTLVAAIEDGKAKIDGTYSRTTLRHIKEFLKQNGFKAENEAQILKDYKL